MNAVNRKNKTEIALNSENRLVTVLRFLVYMLYVTVSHVTTVQ